MIRWHSTRRGGIPVSLPALALFVGISVALLAAILTRPASNSAAPGPSLGPYPDASGMVSSYVPDGKLSPDSPFFQPLGTNGRSCATCHAIATGMTLTPASVQARFTASDGLDPLFRPADGADAPNLPVATLAERTAAYRLLLHRGVIRMESAMPPNADFSLIAVDDPYHYASARGLSLFRRPLPATNLAFLSVVTWDGREMVPGRSIPDDLRAQAETALRTHEQAASLPSPDDLARIVRFEQDLFTAQVSDTVAGDLTSADAQGGPERLYAQLDDAGRQVPPSAKPIGASLGPAVLTLYSSWRDGSATSDTTSEKRASIARGEALFNTRTFAITDVPGFTDARGQRSVMGTCASCHDVHDVGNHSLPQLMNTGVSAARRRTPDFPLYTFRCTATGQIVRVTDPGQGIVTGTCDDLGKFKVPSLRGLAARPPYFHDGSAASLSDVVGFYEGRFLLRLTPAEENDLVNFLAAL